MTVNVLPAHQPLRDGQSESEPFRVGLRRGTLEGDEDPPGGLAVHADARVRHPEPQETVPVTGLQDDLPRLGELHRVREQVVGDLLDAVGIAPDRHVRAGTLVREQQPLAVGRVRVFLHDTVQQAAETERHLVQRLFRLVQARQVEQAVGKAHDVAGSVEDVLQIGIAPFPVSRVHRQFRAAADGVQRAPDVVRQGHDDALAYLQHLMPLAV